MLGPRRIDPRCDHYEKSRMSDAVREEIVHWVAAVQAASRAMPDADTIGPELMQIEMAQARGYFLPDEDECVRLRYLQYLEVRAALTQIPGSIALGSGGKSWNERLPEFVTAFAASWVLAGATRALIDLALERPVLWKKLDEEDLRIGLPRKSFTRLYRASVSPESLVSFRKAVEFYQEHRREIAALSSDPVVGPVVKLLEGAEGRMGERRESVKRHLIYRWFSFRRRHRSAWRQVIFGLFEAGGSAISELRQPGSKPPGTPKRLSAPLREELLATLRPGDLCVTRHDDALSNLFLPGFWPHATLYLGEEEGRCALGVAVSEERQARLPGSPCFLESKKDGVRFRPAAETLAVDACVVLRPVMENADLAQAIGRAMEHEGKLYDFLFDFRSSDRLACTEVIYRGIPRDRPSALSAQGCVRPEMPACGGPAGSGAGLRIRDPRNGGAGG